MPDPESWVTMFEGPYSWLSNFWSCTVELDGVVYPSVENAYQAAKCARPEDRVQFVACSAGEAKRRGQRVELVAAWDKTKVHVMRLLVEYKFRRHYNLRRRLLATGEAHLEEGNWWGDTFWGTVNRKGENHLGKILMEVRARLRAEGK